ncbi:MAG: hypothetical protein QOG41_618, partial [Thermoleophilaceae bacterium]|nr:hypothetical protein [Thermoleophilaceae bacterium]
MDTIGGDGRRLRSLILTDWYPSSE